MGVLKNLKTEWDERGYGPIEGSLCPQHVHDQFLKDSINEIGTETCTYCGGSGAAPLEAVMAIVKGPSTRTTRLRLTISLGTVCPMLRTERMYSSISHQETLTPVSSMISLQL